MLYAFHLLLFDILLYWNSKGFKKLAIMPIFMFDKIKGLIEAKEEIDKINKFLEETKNSLADFKEEFSAVKKELDDIRLNQKEFLKNFKENMDIIKNTKDDLKNSVYDFNLLKNKLQNKIVEKFEEELKKELNINLEKLKKESENYNTLKTNLDAVSLKTKGISNEIDKFIEIGKSLKKEDFELTQYHRELLKADHEKLELLQRIDVLEKLIAKLRRGHA